MKMHPSTAEPIGDVFPPRHEWDVAAYVADDVAEGYRDYNPDLIAPGSNRSPSYSWGWLNRRQDATGEPDGFEGVRRAYIRLRSNAH